jgi:hypothetical protein
MIADRAEVDGAVRGKPVRIKARSLRAARSVRRTDAGGNSHERNVGRRIEQGMSKASG